MTKNIGRFMAMGLAIVAFALTPGAAKAQSYTGSWQTMVSRSLYGNGTYCVKLRDDGSFGWPHSGEATLYPSEGTDEGTFRVINGLMIVTFSQPGGTADIGSLTFTGPASDGQIGKGAYEQFYGLVTDSGMAVFGAKDSCPSGELREEFRAANFAFVAGGDDIDLFVVAKRFLVRTLPPVGAPFYGVGEMVRLNQRPGPTQPRSRHTKR